MHAAYAYTLKLRLHAYTAPTGLHYAYMLTQRLHAYTTPTRLHYAYRLTLRLHAYTTPTRLHYASTYTTPTRPPAYLLTRVHLRLMRPLCALLCLVCCAGRAQSYFLTILCIPGASLTRLAPHLKPAHWILCPIAASHPRISGAVHRRVQCPMRTQRGALNLQQRNVRYRDAAYAPQRTAVVG